MLENIANAQPLPLNTLSQIQPIRFPVDGNVFDREALSNSLQEIREFANIAQFNPDVFNGLLDSFLSGDAKTALGPEGLGGFAENVPDARDRSLGAYITSQLALIQARNIDSVFTIDPNSYIQGLTDDERAAAGDFIRQLQNTKLDKDTVLDPLLANLSDETLAALGLGGDNINPPVIVPFPAY
jgi:hypothetical protein